MLLAVANCYHGTVTVTVPGLPLTRIHKNNSSCNSITTLRYCLFYIEQKTDLHTAEIVLQIHASRDCSSRIKRCSTRIKRLFFTHQGTVLHAARSFYIGAKTCSTPRRRLFYSEQKAVLQKISIHYWRTSRNRRLH